MKIRITNGATRIGSAIRTRADGVLAVDEPVGARLIACGAAVAVDVGEGTPPYNADTHVEPLFGENGQTHGESIDDTGDKESASVYFCSRPEYSADMKQQELRDIGAACGIDFPAICSKASMVEALDEYFASPDTEGGELDLSPQMPE